MTESERRHRLERALDCAGRTHDVSDVVHMIREGRAQYWQNGDGMVVTELEDYPRFKAVNYWLVWGEKRACLALQDQIDAWAKGEGCEIATANGRKGWGNVLAPFGWKPRAITFYKPLIQEGVP